MKEFKTFKKQKELSQELPKESGVCGIYNKISEQYAADFIEPSDHIDKFLELIPKDGNILDAGSGVGVDSNYMNSKGFKVTSIDLSEGMINTAKKNFPKLNFNKQDIREINYPDSSFDGVLSSYVLIHLPKKDIPEVLIKFNNILKKDGILYVVIKEGDSTETYINEPYIPSEKLFLNIMSTTEIQSLLNKHKFSLIKTYSIPRKSTSSGEVGFADLIIIAKKMSDVKNNN